MFSIIIQITRQDFKKVCCLVYSHFTQHSPSTCTGFVQFRGTGGHEIRSHDACVPGSASSGQSQNTQESMNTLSPRGSVSPMFGPKMISHPSSSSSAYDAPIITRDRTKNATAFILCCKKDYKQFTFKATVMQVVFFSLKLYFYFSTSLKIFSFSCQSVKFFKVCCKRVFVYTLKTYSNQTV